MKKLLFILCSICVYTNLPAQEYYFDGTSIDTGEITFKVSKKGYILNLDNINNFRVDQNWQYWDGTVVELDADNVDYQNAGASFNLELMKKALKATFTQAEYKRLSKAERSGFEVFFAIDGNGKVLEVSFILNARKNPELARVPPEKYALLEKNIRKYIKWETNEYAKKFKFMHAFSQFQFQNLQINYGRPSVSIGR